MFRQIGQRVGQQIGGILLAASVALTGEAALFCWTWRDGDPHAVSVSTGMTAAVHFGAHFWPFLSISAAMFLLGLLLAGPPRRWFSTRWPGGNRPDGKGGSDAV